MPVASSAQIHPSATIDPAADIGERVQIGPQVVIEGAVSLGADSIVRPGAYLVGPMVIGMKNDIGKNVVLGERPQHLSESGEGTRTAIGDRNVFRENCTVHRGSSSTGITIVGNDNYFMVGAHIAHDCRVGNQVVMANGSMIAGHCELHDRVFLSALAAIHQHTRLGKCSMLSGLGAATKDILPGMTAAGRDVVVGVNVVGLRRAGASREEIGAVREAYRILYRSGLIQSGAVEKLRTELGHLSIIAEMLDFISTSKRGFAREYQEEKGSIAAA